MGGPSLVACPPKSAGRRGSQGWGKTLSICPHPFLPHYASPWEASRCRPERIGHPASYHLPHTPARRGMRHPRVTLCFMAASKENAPWRLVVSGLAIISIMIAAYAAFIASEARHDARAVAGLDLHPALKICTLLHQVKNNPPHFTVINDGPVDAIQLVIELINYRYFEKERKIRTASSGSQYRYKVARLHVLQEVSYPLIDHWLNVSSRPAEPPRNNVIGIRLTYRRPLDKQEYVENAFYFVNPDGRWGRRTRSISISRNLRSYQDLSTRIRTENQI